MSSTVIDIEQLPEFQALHSDVVPFIRPPVVQWKSEPLSDYIKQELTQFKDLCCCSNLRGFEGVYHTAPVPEPSIGLMLMAGVLFIGIWKKFCK